MTELSCLRLPVLAIILLSGSLASQVARAVDTPNWSSGNSTFATHGYLRSTFGTDGNGNNMASFQAPGARAKYRLGNEADMGVELQLQYAYHLDGLANPIGRNLQLVGRLANFQDLTDYDEFSLTPKDDNIAEAYARLENLTVDGTDVWFGRRYYDRKDLHINDYFWLNPGQGSQYGFGAEALTVGGPGKLDLAIFRAKDEHIPHLTTGTDQDNLYTYTLDARYRGIPTNPGGSLTLWGQLADRPANSTIGYQNRTGYALGGWHEQSGIGSGVLKTAALFRQGATVVQGGGNARAARENQGYDLQKAYMAELNTDYFAESTDKTIGVDLIGILHRENHGTTAGTIDWLSAGVRPYYAFNDYLSLAPEIGLDYVNNKPQNKEGLLGKGTLALQLSTKPGFFNRPVLRAFATSALWNDDLRGSIGTSPGSANFGADTHGTTYGLQLEYWW